MIEFPSSPPEWLTKEDQLKKIGWSFKSENMAELLSKPEPQLSWLIEGLWVDKSRGLIAGNPGIGKTWLALDMLFSVCTGKPCLGKYAPSYAAPVLLVEEESSVFNLARRIHALAKGRGLSDSDLVHFHHVTRQFLKMPKHEKELIAFIKNKGIKLVVFDSLRRFHSVDENSSEKMQPILDAFAHINNDTEASVALIHHLSKQSGDKAVKRPIFERLRGTSDLWAWRDCLLGMEGEQDATVSSCSFQFRDAESPKPIGIQRLVDAKSGAVSLGLFNFQETEEFSEKATRMLDYIKTHSPISKDESCRKAGGRKSDNVYVFDALVESGKLMKFGFKWGINSTQ